MTESIKLMKLDLMMTKKYWKEMLFAGAIISVSILPNVPILLNIIMFMFANTLLGYPFMIQEKDKMDKFYSIIAVTKKEIVRSKYLLTLFYMVIIGTALILINLILYYVVKVEVDLRGALLLIGMGMLLYSGVAALQLPCYFKWGYSKSRMITAILPILVGVGVPGVVLGGAKLLGKEQLLDIGRNMARFISNQYNVLLIGMVIGIILCF
ncbi:MAG: ABC-2 transporter permease, partial [Niameybacter sp.]